MCDIPAAMMANGRQPDQIFEEDEELYRRLPPGYLDGNSIAIEAIQLPDISVNRQKYGPPKWLLLSEEFSGWGVFKFQVQHIPAELIHLGTTRYTFNPEHSPNRKNYPHTEVKAYNNGVHIDINNSNVLLDPGMHQRWRQQLQWKCSIAIQPSS